MATEMTQWILALSHPLRRQILRAVKEAGTVDAAELCQGLDLALGTVAYHLKVLVDYGLLVEVSSTRSYVKAHIP